MKENTLINSCDIQDWLDKSNEETYTKEDILSFIDYLVARDAQVGDYIKFKDIYGCCHFAKVLHIKDRKTMTFRLSICHQKSSDSSWYFGDMYFKNITIEKIYRRDHMNSDLFKIGQRVYLWGRCSHRYYPSKIKALFKDYCLLEDEDDIEFSYKDLFLYSHHLNFEDELDWLKSKENGETA